MRVKTNVKSGAAGHTIAPGCTCGCTNGRTALGGSR
jgi:hypothetical protein